MPFIHNVGSFRPLKDYVFVTDLEAGARKTLAGIIIPNDDMKNTGIRDRWGKVWAVGPEVDDLKPGDWIFIKHGRWTNGIELQTPDGTIKVWRAEYPESTLLVSDENPLITTEFR